MGHNSTHLNNAMQVFEEIAKESAGKLLAKDDNEEAKELSKFVFIDRDCNRKQKKRKDR